MYPIAYPGVPPIEASPGELEERAASAQAALEGRLQQQAPSVAAEAVVITRGGLDELIARTAELDLLVCGSGGYGPLSAVLLGGVTHTLMQKAACPLILIPRGVQNALDPMLTRESVAP